MNAPFHPGDLPFPRLAYCWASNISGLFAEQHITSMHIYPLVIAIIVHMSEWMQRE
jgi:hypothetical protein